MDVIILYIIFSGKNRFIWCKTGSGLDFLMKTSLQNESTHKLHIIIELSRHKNF